MLALQASNSLAITNDPDISKQQFLEKERRELIREKERTEYKKIQDSHKKEKKVIETIDDLGGGCIDIDEIIINGASIINQDILYEKITDNYEGDCLAKSDLIKIQSQLQNHYIKHGYSTSRVFFNLQRMSEKILELNISEGKVESINHSSKKEEFFSLRRRVNLATVFPLKKRKFLI